MKKVFKLLVMVVLLLTVALVPEACSFDSTPKLEETFVTRYTVTFVTNGGSDVSARKVVEGGTVREPVTERNGFTFTGWYEEKACQNLFDFTTQILDNITLYAGWKKNETTYHTITFDCNGGTYSGTETYIREGIAYDSIITAPIPTCAGYVFDGWYTLKDEGTEVDFNQQKITDDSTFYAHWIDTFVKDNIVYSAYANDTNGTSVAVNKYNGQPSNLVVPESVEYRGSNYNVTGIGYRAFYGCRGLTSITIPEGVTSIGDHAFSNCRGLTSITIPEKVTSIDFDAFQGCSGLTSIIVDSGNTVYTSGNGANCIIRKEDNFLFAGCQNTAIPNTVTSIGDSAFYGCSGLTSITIPSSVTSIYLGAFQGCSGLTSIIVDSGNTVYTSGDNANCIIRRSDNCLIVGCQNTAIPNTVTSIYDDAFRECSSLTSITIPSSVTSIDGNAFHGCSGLTSITISEGVTSIGYGAFSNCSSLTSITIPSSVTSIDSDAFQ